jgi:hypothetical protein
MSAPASRAVHPCVLSVTEGTRGVEFSTWAHITTNSGRSNKVSSCLPNLVTASASTISVYRIDENNNGKLWLEHSFGNLAGTVVFLGTLKATQQADVPDALLVGFAGHARWTVLQVQHDLLQATSLLDLTSILSDYSYGQASNCLAEQDMILTCLESRPGRTVVGCVLGGGVAVAVVEVGYQKAVAGWIADEPYVLPLANLSTQLPHRANHLGNKSYTSNSNNTHPNSGESIATGFGDILSAAFLSGYLEPVLVLLHSDVEGPVWSGRLGRERGVAGAPPLFVTALSISVVHGRTAVLWSQVVSADATKILSFGKTGCLVVGANTLVILEIGKVQQVIAMNGWARSTCPAALQTALQANPVVKLAIQLDGCCVTWLSEHSAIMALRTGQLYVLQRTDDRWAVMPLGQTLGAVGEVAHLASLPIGGLRWLEKMKMDENKASEMQMGVLFAGSRTGDSLFLGYALEIVTMPWAAIKSEGQTFINFEGSELSKVATTAPIANGLDRILQLEEEALYGTDRSTPLHIVRDSEEEETADIPSDAKRLRPVAFTVVRTIVPLDVLVNLGPLGPSCEGPICAPPNFMVSQEKVTTAMGKKEPVFGSPACIYPCGYGSSGGVAVVTVPGRDDRMILAEEDCLNVDAIFSLSTAGIILLGMGGGGIKVLRLKHSNALEEVDVQQWCRGSKDNTSGPFPSCVQLFTATLLQATEFNDRSFALLVSSPLEDGVSYSVVILNEENGNLCIKYQHVIASTDDKMLSSTPFVHSPSDEAVAFGCNWLSGDAFSFILDANGRFRACQFAGRAESLNEEMDVDNDEEREFYRFYSKKRIVAVDVFQAPGNIFSSAFFPDEKHDDVINGDVQQRANVVDSDEDEQELYCNPGDPGNFVASGHIASSQQDLQNEGDGGNPALYIAVCRQSGQLEIYLVPLIDNIPRCCWKSSGCGLGVSSLTGQNEPKVPLPKTYKVHAREIRFFECGPIPSKTLDTAKKNRSLCLAVDCSSGDLSVYRLAISQDHGFPPRFEKFRMKSVFRRSQEQARHRTKLIRKRMVVDVNDGTGGFVYNRLYRFSGISGQAGMFAAVPRPFWLCAERGKPSMLFHRTRHASPAGGKLRPVSGFCSAVINDKSGNGGFITLHERVGRIGSQRLTLFHGLAPAFGAHGLLPGGGMCVEKILFGMTVRHIQFINDPFVSTSEHPLYALLVSKKLEVDQSDLNDDGLTAQERKETEEEKENAKIKRQVEADLGGFDLENEWVEEIERDDCFAVEMQLGGAPPIPKEAFAVWIVDAANNWMVVDSFKLDEYEHGMTLSIMELTEFPEEPGSSNDTDVSGDELSKRMFVAVGTGVLDHNGEDVASRGRAILLELKRTNSSAKAAGRQVVELSFCYEKEIFHGAVTSLVCLSSEGKNRLLIGAGADINVEQWGNAKLTQVGFFRATMQVLHIIPFKSFLLLSDAYDSLYFLIWRESDKSLTLLAKDYDPIPVYAAGVMSRGPAMTFLCHDDRQNLQFFQYAPGEAAARGGNRLVCRADYHLGTQTTSFASHFCRSSLMIHSATPTSTLAALKQQDSYFGRSEEDQRLGAYFGTADGGMGAVVPLSEPVYWRLTALQSIVANALESDCALAPRAWRLYRRSTRRGGCRSNDRKKGVIDGDLVLQYADLSISKQEDIASAIGSTVDLILDNLLELQCGSLVL